MEIQKRRDVIHSESYHLVSYYLLPLLCLPSRGLLLTDGNVLLCRVFLPVKLDLNKENLWARAVASACYPMGRIGWMRTRSSWSVYFIAKWW